LVAVVHGCRIGDEEQIEFAALGDLRGLGHHRPAAIAGRRALIAPAGSMIPGAQPKYTKVNLPFRRGHRSLLMSEQSKRSPD
jgi:hypothetical protein